jgi:thioredoxin-like negative regulator of GroEL
MNRQRALVIVAGLLVLAVVSYLAYTFWAGPAGDRPTLMYFRADLWAYCRDGIKREYRRRLDVVYVSMDERGGKELAREYGVVGTPTILLLDGEGNRVNMLRGSLPRSLIEQAVEDLVGP